MAIASWAVEEVRSGTIRLWHGLLANIPAGYVLCDGGSGTPDLRDKFVKGAAAGQNPGGTGGAATHTHTDHPATATSTFAATSKLGTSTANTATIGHSHNTPVLSHNSPNSEPAYYTVAYIMKV